MRQEVLEYAKSQRVGILAVEMLDGSPHAATVHFANSEDPFIFYFATSLNSRKVSPLLKKKVTRASFVVGADESNRKTLQIDGELELITSQTEEAFESTYFGKFPEKKQPNAPTSARLKFTPKWWRFTDWTVQNGPVLLSSE